MVPRAHSTCNEHSNDEASNHDPVARGILDTVGVAGVPCHPPEQWCVAQPYEYKLQGVEDEERNAKDEERNAKDDGSQDIQEGLVGFLMHCGSSFQGRRWAPATLTALLLYVYYITRSAVCIP